MDFDALPTLLMYNLENFHGYFALFVKKNRMIQIFDLQATQHCWWYVILCCFQLSLMN